MRFIISFFLFTFLTVSTIFSQNDVKAEQILNDVSKNLNNVESLEMTYVLKYFIPESAPVVQDGIYQKKNQRIKMSLGDVIFFVLDDAVYQIDKKENIVTIKDRNNTTEGIMNPSMILDQFVTGSYTYSLSPMSSQKESIIVFKPIDRNSEYTKLRVVIDKNSNIPKNFFMSLRNGTQIILDVLNIKQGSYISDSIFDFSIENYPSAEVEDLRF